jgi:methylmalonyl-CoA mutase, N-terminal domain
MGGMLKAIERGYVQQEIQNAAYEYQQAVDRQHAVVVGVNRFHSEEEKSVPIQRIDPALWSRSRWSGCGHCARSAMPRHGRPRSARSKTRRGRRQSHAAILAAVEANATVGEISDAR